MGLLEDLGGLLTARFGSTWDAKTWAGVVVLLILAIIFYFVYHFMRTDL